MGVIKSDNAATVRTTQFSLADIERQAHAIILQAKSQAGRILAEAQRVGDQMKQQRHAAGFDEGKTAGFQQGLADGQAAGRQEALNEQRDALAELVQTLAGACSDLDASRRRLESEATIDVMRLAVAIARRATKRLGARDPNVLTANVTEAMKLAVRACDVRIAVHPSQRATLERTIPQLKMQWPTLKHVELLDDASLAPGGCRVFSGSGQIDADLDGQIDRIAADLVPDAARPTNAESAGNADNAEALSE